MSYGRPTKERYAAEKAPATPTKDVPASAAKSTPGSMFSRLTRGFGIIPSDNRIARSLQRRHRSQAGTAQPENGGLT